MAISVRDLLALTLKSLISNPIRSTLTTLGIFIGVASVTATMQVGTISQLMIEKKLTQREAPQITAYLWAKDGRTLYLEDLEFLQNSLTNVKAISTYIRFDNSSILFKDKEAKLSLYTVSEDYLMTSGRRIVRGRFFNEKDFQQYRSVAVIDEFLAQELFLQQNPVGEKIFSGGKPYIVVGVMETKLRFENDTPQGEILVPLSLYQRLTGSREIKGVQIRPQNFQEINKLQKETEKLLLARYPGAQYWVNNNIPDILEQQQTLQLLSQGLLALGIISLIVGGVGIANITLSSVTERTSEIGLLLAIGATKLDILQQFILEALLLSLVGGTLALTTVHLTTTIIADKFELPYQFEYKIAFLALGASVTVGTLSSFFPAQHASQLDPVKALQS